MKYNKSEIMKKAWELKKSLRITMSEALKKSWEAAKKNALKRIVNKRIRFQNIEKGFLRKMNDTTFLALKSGIEVDDTVLEKETEKAIEISTEWNGYRKRIWIPKSVCEYVFA